ncbi:MAG: hypothetical protein HN640_03910 [Gammaproteobacteria bacterium]|jgi:hypothetical protein|nr:hypothetical protein [Gammaproteobacteria bacterium]MBT4655071.1 hypothetical protein [Gammaproteobacteria bacterium]MBT7932623.1 hypothetical protein [Gammaproteobacteria bacterium]
MAMPPQGPPPRILGMKITSNRIEAVLVLFVGISLSLILYGNDMINGSKTIVSLGVIWALYLWIFKKPERPY